MKTVLIVDDEELIRWSLSHALRDRYIVFTAADAYEAVRILRRAPVDAVITDLQMPGRDGVELAEHVRRVFPAIRILVLTAHATDAVARHLEAIGCDACLPKPFRLETVGSRLEESLAIPPPGPDVPATPEPAGLDKS